MKISIIIPVLNEAETIGRLVTELHRRENGAIGEIVVVDGGSADATVARAEEAGARVFASEEKGRAVQMDFGAERARFPMLYFLHADSRPPEQFDQKILRAHREGYPAGCFRLAFDWDHPVLNFYAWCTRFDLDAFRFGDQSLFISKELYDRIGGYKTGLILMEDNEIIRRIKNDQPFKILPDEVVTSARKYRANGVVRLQLIFTMIYVLFFLGISQERLIRIYKKFISG
ncbi:MAG: TIGR04283 family arsenosugar biosynthesis glycosyltransferase [Balneolaceae bacterium]|nr:TIGR04283 family arsenosugar biosynthesis glycosyltransferase [Balneolaceae bacterium]